MYIFLPCDDGKFKNEGLEVEENGRLVQRDVSQYLLHACLGMGPVFYVNFTCKLRDRLDCCVRYTSAE